MIMLYADGEIAWALLKSRANQLRAYAAAVVAALRDVAPDTVMELVTPGDPLVLQRGGEFSVIPVSSAAGVQL